MTLLYMDGYDVYDNLADVVAGGTVQQTGSNHLFNSTGGRFGGGAIGATVSGTMWSVQVNAVTDDTVWFSCYYRHTTLPGAVDETLLALRNASGVTVAQFRVLSNGRVQVVARSGSTVNSTAAPFSGSTAWHRIVFSVNFGSTSSNGTINAYVDGTLVANYPSCDLRLTGNLDRVDFGGSRNGFLYDDFVINNNQGSTFLTPPAADYQIDTLRPDADGAVTDWVGAYTDVDDALAASDGDTTYISSSTVAEESRFTVNNLGVGPGLVGAVLVRYKAKNVSSGVRTIRGLINRGGSEAVGASFIPPTTYAWRGALFAVDPTTGVAFTQANVNALEAGVEVVS